MSGKGSEEKTEKPTPKKLKESRKEGQVARTPELGAWAGVLALAMSLHWLVGLGIGKIRNLMGETLVAIDRPSGERALSLLGDASQLILILSAGLGTFILVIAVIGAVAQGGLFFATKALKPKWSRLNPLEGAKRLFGPHALWEGAKMLVKSSLVGFFVWRAVKSLMPVLGALVPIPVALDLAAEAAAGLMRDIAFAALLAAGLPFISRGLDLIVLGEAEAFHMGIAVERLKRIAIVLVAAATGAAVSVAGVIGFVGIIVPHLLRLLIGPDNRYLLPASALLGAALLLLADAVSRTVVAPAELPIGIVTALIGAPFFLWLLLRMRREAWL